jgi:hypothetical protein
MGEAWTHTYTQSMVISLAYFFLFYGGKQVKIHKQLAYFVYHITQVGT